MKKNAFTIIELIFVVVILGILSTVAIPKFAKTVLEAEISKGRAEISSIRSAIITERQTRLITGDNKFIEAGDGAGKLHTSSTQFFGGVLTYPIKPKTASGHWHTLATVDSNSSTVKYRVGTDDMLFTYTRNDGVFTCTSGTYCSELID